MKLEIGTRIKNNETDEVSTIVSFSVYPSITPGFSVTIPILKDSDGLEWSQPMDNMLTLLGDGYLSIV